MKAERGKKGLQGKRAAKAETGIKYYTCVESCTLTHRGSKGDRPVECSAQGNARNKATIIQVIGELPERLTKPGLRRIDDPNTKFPAKFAELQNPSEKTREAAIFVSLPKLKEAG